MVKYIFYLSLFFSFIISAPVYGEVCVSDEQSIDIITVLDSSLEDLTLLTECNKLVKELYTELEIKDKKIVELTDQVISANKDIIKYKTKYESAKRVAWYTSILSGILLVLHIAPLL